ncbi:hypothetical protein [Streptomyces sp. NPDC006668]|uniref:hypothetical protein n=1 Tax=Streptomyces sp. NPDC006668 TaxID=3156903 RepID=UPI0033DB38CE
MKPIDPGLPETVSVWLRVWRAVVVERLRAADPPWTLERMSAELARRMGGVRLEGGARSDASGTAKPTLQRFFAGDRVPARDVVQHLLDIACETLDPPPSHEEMSELWSAYRAALRTSSRLLADLYDALDQRDTARRHAEELQQAKDQLAEDLALSRRQEQRLKVLLGHASAELEHAQQTAILRDDETQRARAEAAELTRRVGELEEQLQQSRQDQERLEQEISRLHEQETISSGAHTKRITDLQSALETVREENEELTQLLRTAVQALHDAQQRARSGEDAPRREEEPALPARRSRAELERRHDVAMQAVEHLSEQLRSVSRQLADARAELLRRDGVLARLVEEHAEEIASLRADRVLAEADTVLSLALQHLDTAPAALPPASDVPTSETIDVPSSTPHRPAVAADPPAWKHPLARAGAGATRAPGRPRSAPVGNATAATGQDVGGQAHRPGLPGDTPFKRALIVGALVGIVLAGIFVIVQAAMRLSGARHDDSKATSSAAAPKTASVSPLPRRPEKDPVADIGSQEVNTVKVMGLPSCTNADIRPSLSSAHNTYSSGGQAHIELTVAAADSGRAPCRVDAARNRAVLTITPADGSSPLWDSSSCTDGHQGHRWIAVTRSQPAHVNFVWDGIPNPGNCGQRAHAAAGAYLVETTFAGHKCQTSFVFATDAAPQEQTSPSPSRAATRHAGTSTGSSSTSGGSVGGLLGDSGSRPQSSPPPTPSTSASSGQANGANGGGTNGSAGANGGLFGGPT